MNQVTTSGNVVWLKGGRTKSGTIYVMFRVAMKRPYKNKNTGQYQSDYAFCTAFDSKRRHLATFIGKNAKKGYFIALTGHIHSREVNNNGQRRDINSLAVDDVDKIFPSMKAIQNGSYQIPKRSNNSNNNYSNNNNYYRNNGNGNRNNGNNNNSDPFSNNGSNGNNNISDDDLPF